MAGREDSQPYEFRIPIRIIDEQLGRDRLDDAGDLMIGSLNELSDYAGQYRYSFSFETSHPNPWFHHLTFSVWGLPESRRKELEKMLEKQGLTALRHEGTQ